MADAADFQLKQYEFAAHIRDPERNPAPEGIEDRRMAIYRDLFFNNLLKLIGNTFPVLRKLHTPERWRALIREFMAKHRSTTPYFLEIPKEFLEFLNEEHESDDEDFPFLNELAHYEWVELALSVSSEENDLAGIDAGGDLLEGVPVKSVLAWAVAYTFPVHRINETYQPQEPGEEATFLAVYRAPDDQVGFAELNAVTAALLDRIDNNAADKSGRELLTILADEMSYDPAALIEHGASMLSELKNKHILLGTKAKPPVRPQG